MKKSQKNIDATEVMIQIQGQLAELDKKLEAFINKSLTELAQVLAAQKPTTTPTAVSQPAPKIVRPSEPSRRPMFAVICFDCGKDTEIPFKPSPGRPVYCKECFAKRKAGQMTKVQTQAPQPAAPVVAIPVPKTETEVKTKKKAPSTKKSVAKKKPAPKKKR